MPHYHDPRIERLAHAAADAMPRFLRDFEEGRVPTSSGALGDVDAGEAFAIVKALLAEGEHVIAAPVALLLAVCHPDVPGHAYFAGRTFQKLQAWQLAGWLFEQAARRADSALARYRLGSCLQALGQRALAIEQFERAYDLARTGSSDHRLQEHIEQRLLESNVAG
ncbi:MAG TPA: hypothetical protein VH328_03440 [Burkholderiaceae bacterium]|nr:hypothetical protein [Burkholderiaceae bacterium]